jgi:uncharacterized protein YecE (DUF72 family)
MGSGSNLRLFDEHPSHALAEKLKRLAERGVYFGTSSWKYEGWLGSIYTPERYFTRGRFSKKKFEETCLAEYAGIFPAVCGDFSFYQFPSGSYWKRLFDSAPDSLLFAFKVPEMITVQKWPTHARYGQRGGEANESFLDAELFDRMFAGVLGPYKKRVAAMIFEFGTFSKGQYENGGAFLKDLEPFLSKLPKGFRYSIEIRNREYLEPAYFDCLRKFNVAHVFSSWTRMPDLREQTAIAEAYTGDFTVARALLRPGRSYEQAVKQFEPYDHMQEPNDGARDGLRRLMKQSQERNQPAFLFVNNRLEGHAPGTIEAVADA